MSKRFLKRGYGENILHRAINIAEGTKREKILCDKKPRWGNVSVPVFSTPFSLEFRKIRNILTRHIPILFEDDIFAKVLSGGFKAVSHRAPSLSNLLSPSEFRSGSTIRIWLDFKWVFKCGSNNWPYCPRVKGEKFQSTSNNRIYDDIKSFINCNTRYVIYSIWSHVRLAGFNMWVALQEDWEIVVTKM